MLRGLQVPTKCHALMAHHSHVTTAFKDIKIRTEEDFLDALIQHYEILETTVEGELKTIQPVEKQARERCPDKKTVLRHDALMLKTTENVEKLMKKLEEGKMKRKKPRKHPGTTVNSKQKNCVHVVTLLNLDTFFLQFSRLISPLTAQEATLCLGNFLPLDTKSN
jgi:hypothetical protein